MGGRILTIITVLKTFLILGVPFGILMFSNSNAIENLTRISEIDFSWGAFGSAMLAALWAFDGWIIYL
jgi:amino acid transporter